MEQIAVLRAQWLAQLAQTIDSAQQLAWQLGTHGGTSSEARDLYGKLEAAKMELEALRGIARGGGESRDLEAGFLEQFGWTGPVRDPKD